MRVSLLSLCFAASFQSGEAPREESSLRVLRPAVKRLDEGLAAFIRGKLPAEAFKPWKPENVPIDRTSVLRGDMKTHGVVAGENFAIELEVQLWSEGKGIYRITVLANVTPGEASILALTGKPFDGTAKDAVPLSKCGGDAEPFKDAAEFLVKRLKEGRSEELVFASPQRFAKRIPKQFQEGFESRMKESMSMAAQVCRAVAAAKYDEVRVQLGEQYFTALGADGSTKDGFIRGKLRISDSGEILYRLNRFETE